MNTFILNSEAAKPSLRSMLPILTNHKLIAASLYIGLATYVPFVSGQVAATEIIITGDSSTISGFSSEAGPVFTYEGNVVLTTETIEIRGDKAIVKFNPETDEINTAQIIGNPAQFEQTNQENSVLTFGSSEEIEYLEESTEIILRGSASITQQGIFTSCDEIVYSFNTNLFEGIGNCVGRVVGENN